MTKEAKKNDAEKPRLELLPGASLEEIANVLGIGAKKYSDWNWANGFAWSRPLGATLRHLFAFQQGEDVDAETGKPHLAHAGCEILFLLEHYLRDLGTDDRHVWEDELKDVNVKMESIRDVIRRRQSDNGDPERRYAEMGRNMAERERELAKAREDIKRRQAVIAAELDKKNQECKHEQIAHCGSTATCRACNKPFSYLEDKKE